MIMSGAGRTVAFACVAAACVAAAVGLPSPRQTGSATIVSSLRAEPRSFNRYVARDLSTAVVSYLTQAALVRVNRVTDQLEPELAADWELLADHRTYRLHLRKALRFSDGAPFTADDVVFSFNALYDRRAATTIADSLLVGGEPLAVAAEDPTTVVIRFPTSFGPGLRILDGVPILPRHRLASALEHGTFAAAWNLATPPGEIVGLGPYRLVRYQPGQRLLFERNSYYWQAAEALPRADRMQLDIVADQDAESLRLLSGALDFTQSELRAADRAAARSATRTKLSLVDLGVGVDGDLFWINLHPQTADQRTTWLTHRDFRRAISEAVDRDAFVRTVYFGAAVPGFTLVSPGNASWYVDAPAPAYNPSAAAQLLDRLRLLDRNHDGIREDDAGHAARFTIVTQSGNTSLERGAAFVRESLARLGVPVDVVALDAGALVERIMSGRYDAAYFRLLTTDTDPSLNADFWRSSGSAHVWHPEQTAPATEWERDIDVLVDQVATTIDPTARHHAWTQVQQIVARELPALCFAYPQLSYAINARISGARPAPFRPPVLWNPATLGVNR